jgi:LysM repeat protein
MPQNDHRFEQLKQKYQPALNAIAQEQFLLQNVNVEGDKLFIRGEAPSREAVWEQIKLIDLTYSDLTAHITVNENQTPKTPTAGASVGMQHSSRTCTVKAGDSLSKISNDFYGTSGDYIKTFEANRDKLSDKTQPGQELLIPE